MTDSMNFGPDWIRNLSSEGSTAGGTGIGNRYQLADYRYGREEMLALFDPKVKPPASLTNFKSILSETTLQPLALTPTTEEERSWQGRPAIPGPVRGRGGSLERGGRVSRGRGSYQSYGRPSAFDSGWGNGEQPEWSPRKEYNTRTMSSDNWRRGKSAGEEDDGWRSVNQTRHEKWVRSTSWRGDVDEERNGPPERGSRSWHESRGPPRRSWENEDHLPEWATENPTEGGGTFDERGAFHGLDDEDGKVRREGGLQKSTSQQHITSRHPPLASSKSTMSLVKSEENSKKEEEEKPEKKVSESSSEELEKEKQPEKEPVKENCVENRVDEGVMDMLKFIVEEEPAKPAFEVPGVQPPPNVIQDKWFYQDPQGQMQGPFTSMEMADWYKAGYFNTQLKVRRQSDERFFLLGELLTMSGGANPFQIGHRMQFRNDIKPHEQELLQLQYMQMAAFKQAQARVMSEPWAALTLQQQQQELAAQRLLLQQTVPQELGFMQQPPTNPLMHMINQMQQANKLPQAMEKPTLPASIDPQLQMHMNSLLNMQSRMPPVLPNLTGPIAGGLGPEAVLPMTVNPVVNPLNLSRPTVDQIPPSNDPITSLLKQLQQKQHQPPQQMEGLWQQNFPQTNPAPQNQWPPQGMWDIDQQPSPPPQPEEKFDEKEREKKLKEDKKKKELEEKQAKKEAEEKRKQEQRKQEAEKRAAEEKKKKEEERIKKELEKAKKEAEEKRLRELEEKRKMKEQRRIEEEARRKLEEKKLEEEKLRRLEEEEKRMVEEKRMEERRQAKTAPWVQAGSTAGMSLAEIQKAEREKKAQEAAMQLQRQQQMQFLQEQQDNKDKQSGMFLGWAKKPVEPRKVKSLAEIQAEEQERLAKQAAEARLQKEKEPPVTTNMSNIWNGQVLTWANSSSSNTLWNSNSGFWEEAVQKPTQKPSVPKSNSTNTIGKVTAVAAAPVAKQAKAKPKKEEAKTNNNNNNANASDEFTNWCYKSLSNMSTNVDVPTFVSFLRDIESAEDVREYCKEYLGDSGATQQFANNFLEKRRSYKAKNGSHKDSITSTPAITPYVQHSNEFQEVKGKNKKNKKSKNMKVVDARILGFNVTSAPDRINVGDRDYGDNS